MTSPPFARSRSQTTTRDPPARPDRHSHTSIALSSPDEDESRFLRFPFVPHHAEAAFRTPNLHRYWWKQPDRHVMIIVNFQDLADLTLRRDYYPGNADFMDTACRLHNMDTTSQIALFTWCRHLTYQEASWMHLTKLCNLISTRIRETWDVRLPGNALELRCEDLWGDTFQLDMEKTIVSTLDVWRPRWRKFQICWHSTTLLPQCPRRPFTLNLSCHHHVPGVILP